MDQFSVDTVVIGAGPYALSLGYRLGQLGVERRVFGVPMQVWRDMPRGMFLKSFGFATSIPTLQGDHTLPEYCRARALEDLEPIAIDTFVQYGMSFQQRLVPDVEPVRVANVRRQSGGFEVTVETGERLRARRVVVATGLSYFEVIPDMFAGLPAGIVSHTAHHQDFAPFAGLDVTVVGAGQSALQAAALLNESGANVRLIARGQVLWNTRAPLDRPWMDRLRNPNTVVGAGRENWILEHAPRLIHHLPADFRVRFTRAHLGPMGAWWLRDRVEGQFPIYERSRIVEVKHERNKVRLRVSIADGNEHRIETDHIIAGTGYDIDVERIAFLDRSLSREIRRIVRAPMLSRHFQSSVPGLYFIGPSAAFSFGPLARFVAGAPFATATVARHVVRQNVRHIRQRVPHRPSASPEPSVSL